MFNLALGPDSYRDWSLNFFLWRGESFLTSILGSHSLTGEAGAFAILDCRRGEACPPERSIGGGMANVCGAKPAMLIVVSYAVFLSNYFCKEVLFFIEEFAIRVDLQGNERSPKGIKWYKL